ncbi:MAG: hypothetical protein ACFFDI_03390 [Promethearchaeota archaeon]
MDELTTMNFSSHLLIEYFCIAPTKTFFTPAVIPTVQCVFGRTIETNPENEIGKKEINANR